ncbi:hypothetical protein N9O24_00630 [bacterium]|nr:hypothetical protein [bacterium]
MWATGQLKLAIDEILPLNCFHKGLMKIDSRRVIGKIVLVVESAEWAAASPPESFLAIPLENDMKII